MLVDKSKELFKISNKIAKYSKTSTLFDSLTINFINDIYLELKKISYIEETSDLASLAFWLRSQNIKKIYNLYKENINDRLALGIIFHIAPSNTPLNFFYSYLFGLLTGNINIVRIPSKRFFVTEILLNVVDKILVLKKYKKIKQQTFFVRYNKDSDFTEYFSSFCNMRIIWGGDQTIKNIKKISIPSKSREITFADKFSCCLLNSNEIYKLNDKDFFKLIQRFYTDGYFVDQNACSSPHIIFWYGNKTNIIRKTFWQKLEIYSKKKYNLPEIGSIDKFTRFCEDIINLDLKEKNNFNQFVYNVYLKELPLDLKLLKGRWGYFYEYKLNKISDLKKIINDKYQTLTYFGFKSSMIYNNIIDYKHTGIDRIVPVGSAHIMDRYWDGYDMINSLTRVISRF